jgi:hypothetical protein
MANTAAWNALRLILCAHANEDDWRAYVDAACKFVRMMNVSVQASLRVFCTGKFGARPLQLSDSVMRAAQSFQQR